MIVPIILGFYVLVCVGVVLFNCWKAVSGVVLDRRFKARKLTCHAWFWQQIMPRVDLSPAEAEEFARTAAEKLRSHRRLMAFHGAMDELAQSHPTQYAAAAPLLARIIGRLYPFYVNRPDTLQAYYTYLVTHFHAMAYDPPEGLTAFLLEQLWQQRSLYNVENALRAVYSSRRVPLVLTALETLMGDSQLFIHQKLLVDGLLTFEDRDGLITALWQRMDGFSAPMQRLLLDYIRFASGAWGEEVLALFEKTADKETKIACLRYFGRYPAPRFRTPLYETAKTAGEGDWEISAVCMTVLASYPEGETVALLKTGLCSRNWYVRYNAALSLRALRVDIAQVKDILHGDDRYAREMLRYRLELPTEQQEKEVAAV